MNQLLIDNLKKKKATWKDVQSYYNRFCHQITKVLDALEKCNVTCLEVCAESFDISYAGDKHVFTAACIELHKLGYRPASKPNKAKPEAYFTTWWHHKEHRDLHPALYIRFSSTSCTRIKVGSKTQVVDIYETVCE